MNIPIRVYYDNVIISGLITGDLSPADEMLALREMEKAHGAGTIKRVTSRESWREQERTRDEMKRSQLEAARDLVSVVQADHRLVGFQNEMGLLGTIVSNPIISDVVDESLFADLKRLGLKAPDARHFMYAVANNCDWFVTLDDDFLGRRSLLENRCPSIRVAKPSELSTELKRGKLSGAC